MVSNFSVTNENYIQSPIYIGAPEGMEFDQFNVGILKHAVLPGDRSGTSKGLALFQEAVINGVSVVHIQIRSATARTVKIRAATPALILTVALQGSPTIQWTHLASNNFFPGQFNLIYAHRHLQCIHVQPGITDLLNIQLDLTHLHGALDLNKRMEAFMNQANKERSVSYLAQPIYGSPKQQYQIYQLMSGLCSGRYDWYKRDDLLKPDYLIDQLVSLSLAEIESPDVLDFTYGETKEIARVIAIFNEYFSIPNIYQKELRRSSLNKVRFDNAFMQICDCTASQFIQHSQMKLAKRMLEESIPIHMVIRNTGYKDKIHKFSQDFLAYFGVALSKFIKSYEGKPW